MKSLSLRVVSIALVVAFSSVVANAAPDAYGDLKKGIQSGDVKAVEAALAEMIKEGGSPNMKRLISVGGKIPAKRETLYWPLVRGMASFVDKDALDVLGETIIKLRKKPMARDLLYALARNRTRHVVIVLGAILEKGAIDLQEMAAEQLGRIPTQETVDVLVAALARQVAKQKDDSNLIANPLIRQIVIGLTQVSGKEFGPNPVNWQSWWKQNRKSARLAYHKLGGQGGRTGTAADYLTGERRKQFIGLEKAPKKGVLVLSARYPNNVIRARDLNNDHIERSLDRMRVPHTVISRGDFLAYDLKDTGAIVINCAQFNEFCICPTCKPAGPLNNRLRRCSGCDKHIKFSSKLSAPQIQKLTEFVKGGGYVFAEDWVIIEFVQKAYPKYVSAGEKLKADTVDVVPANGQATHPYLKGLFTSDLDQDEPEFSFDDEEEDKSEGRTVVVDVKKEEATLVDVKHEWKIDDESYSIHLENKAKVEKLLSSAKLGVTAKGDSLVAVGFRPGSTVPLGQRGGRTRTGALSGVVVCVLSHFGKQSSAVNEASIENLLLNFLIDANVARTEREVTPRPKKRRR